MRKKIFVYSKKSLEDDVQVFPISAITRKGLDDLLFAVADLIEVTPEFPLYEMKMKMKTQSFINMKQKDLIS